MAKSLLGLCSKNSAMVARSWLLLVSVRGYAEDFQLWGLVEKQARDASIQLSEAIKKSSPYLVLLDRLPFE
jgi:hypothetical protein